VSINNNSDALIRNPSV